MRVVQTNTSEDRPAYPAIVACIGEGRRPSLADLKRLATRIRSEACPDSVIDPVQRRCISRIALAALGQTNEER